MTSYCTEIKQHYTRNWRVSPAELRWSDGPTNELPKDFCVLEFRPTDRRNMWTYATCCMSEQDDENAIELHLFSPIQSELNVELLTVICHYHKTGSRLALGHSVFFGRPWLPGSKCTYGLISLPYLDGPSLEEHRGSNSNSFVRCLWLVPITEDEREFKKNYGVEALEQRFEERHFNYVDPSRASVV